MANVQRERYYAPKTIRNGKLITKRIDTGYYEHETNHKARAGFRFKSFYIRKLGADSGTPGLWVWEHAGHAADDVHATKADALASLAQTIYYGYQLDSDYSC